MHAVAVNWEERYLSQIEAGIEDLRDRYGELDAKLDRFRTELKEDIGNLRTELKQDIGNLRTELKEDIGNLRTELKEDVAELGRGQTSLRTELKQDIADLRGDFKSLQRSLLFGFVAVIAVSLLVHFLR